MVYRVYVEKKDALAQKAQRLLYELQNFLGIKGLKKVRVFNRYDVEDIDVKTFSTAVKTVFSEPQTDVTSESLPKDADAVFAVEYLPGQYDQRADSAAQCIQIMTRANKPTVRTATVYALYGNIDASDIDAVKKYVINPVDSREAALDKPDTLKAEYAVPNDVETLTGFTAWDARALKEFIADRGLAMDIDDILFCQDYFLSEGRNPTLTEIKMIDTYWSDHCRHTTFATVIDSAEFESPLIQKAYEKYIKTREALGSKKPVTLMDIATIAAKYLKKNGYLNNLDESEEINACTVKIKVDVDGKYEDWLLLFKNETHNHPTEIEPFGGAATCIGGAIRDPLSGRGYVYAAMRITGGADPLTPIKQTLKGKLPQKKLAVTAAEGYSSYGNQIGLATCLVDELYHAGYAAKRMEIGAVLGAVPEKNVRRLAPQPGDAVILLGGRTGRDGIGGATGSSKAHTSRSVETCGAEVQKGNAPEERKLQRLFRNPGAAALIKRCNDFGAGGVAVAVGELADGIEINLDAVPKKYEGLDGTELVISESQERMAVVVAQEDVPRLLALAAEENLEAAVIAAVTEEPRLKVLWRGRVIADIDRAFLNSNGAKKYARAVIKNPEDFSKAVPKSLSSGYKSLAGDLNICSKRGLSERFDSTIGAGTVLMPFGGSYGLTPVQAMANKIPVENGVTNMCSIMAWGCNPYILEKSPYHGAYLAVVESVSKLIAHGAAPNNIYLTFQEYFERLGSNPDSWGKPIAALLGAFSAQMGLKIAAIGGKDSMSGSFEDISVPPTLVSFAVTACQTNNVISNEFKKAGNEVILLKPEYDENGLPETASLLKNFAAVHALIAEGTAVSAYTPGYGGVAEAVMKMCFGNMLGFEYLEDVPLEEIFAYGYGSFVLELSKPAAVGTPIGRVTKEPEISQNGENISVLELLKTYEEKLEPVYACNIASKKETLPAFNYSGVASFPRVLKGVKPAVLIPVFPGTNCEYDTARAFKRAGADVETFVIKNLTPADIDLSVAKFAERAQKCQIIFIPGGFSGGDEPDGSGKFITAFFRSAAVADAVNSLLKVRGGLMGGICNGFQALIKLGLVPYGEITEPYENSPTLTFNTIGRHQSRIVRTRVASVMSPWLAGASVGDVYEVPISHGEGRFYAPEELIRALGEGGQVITQYVDLENNPTMDVRFNPNGSVFAVEGICSPDGRVFGKMGHSERIGHGLYKNAPGNYDMKLFESAVKYFN